MEPLNHNVMKWWDGLSKNERMVLIEMLYYMNGSDFEKFGVTIKDYRHVRTRTMNIK